MKALTNKKINSNLINNNALTTVVENAETLLNEKTVFGLVDLWNINRSRKTSFLRTSRALSIY